MGLITLLIFPLPTFFVLKTWEGIDWSTILQFERFGIIEVGFGLQLGFVYAIFALLMLQSEQFKDMPVSMEGIIKSMNLSVFDAVFLSLCAGVGEELLFRSGIQFYLNPIVVSILFIAIHGYLNPFNWRVSLYGLLLLPFILLISYGFYEFGLWFAISAHFMYDLVIFSSIRK